MARGGSRKGRGDGGRRPEPTYVDLSPTEAAPRLGFVSVSALWAFMRRNESEDGQVDLGGGVHAYRRGRRRIVRFPINH